MDVAPLTGFTIGVTADRRADEQIKLLTSRGAACVHGPVIKTHPLGSEEELHEATRRLIDTRPDVVVLTTGLGVRGWLEAASAARLGDELLDVLDGAALYPRGPKAVGALTTAGLEPVWRAATARYVDVVEGLRELGVENMTVAVQLDGAGAAGLCEQIEAMGADVVRVPVYRWSLPEDMEPAERMLRAVAAGRIDALTFTARPAVENFFEIADLLGIGDEVVDAIDDHVEIFCVGPVCATGFTDIGIEDLRVPERYRLGALVQTVVQTFADRSDRFALAGSDVVLQGRFVSVDGGEPVPLTERERAVLLVLLERPGAVCSKSMLLEKVWTGEEADQHAVEVTVARLRARLGVAATGLETVFRRGYRLDIA